MSNLKISGYYFLLLLCLGLCYLTYTPVFEGFDEVGHYSAIRQIAFEEKIPKRSESFLDENVRNYKGPLPYTSGNPPYDSLFTYIKYFSEYNNKNIDSSFGEIKPGYIASNIPNTEYRQHPRLYYIIMAPLERAIGGNSLISQVFILRLFSYCMAAAGLSIALFAALKMTKDVKNQNMLLSFLIYPIAFPMFALEFARIGNDSLCILIYSLILLCAIKWRNSEEDKYVWVMGILLGIGLNTKAFFLPISAGMIVYIVVNSFSSLSRLATNILILIAMILGVGSFWYVSSYLEYGTLTGTNIAIAYEANSKLFILNFDNFIKIIRGLIVIPITFVWGGTYSLVHIPYFFYIPAILMMCYIIINFIKKIIQNQYFYKINFLFIPTLFMLFGLIWHAYVNLAAGGLNSNTPGWYLHIFAPLFAITIGYFIDNKIFLKFYKYYFIYMMFFTAVVNWFQIALFSGCASKSNLKKYAFSDELYCLTKLNVVYENLSAISLFTITWIPLLLLILIYIKLFKEANEKN